MLFFFTFSKKVYALGIFYLVWQIIDAEEVWSNSCFCLFSTMIPGSQTSTYPLSRTPPLSTKCGLKTCFFLTLPLGILSDPCNHLMSQLAKKFQPLWLLPVAFSDPSAGGGGVFPADDRTPAPRRWCFGGWLGLYWANIGLVIHWFDCNFKFN